MWNIAICDDEQHVQQDFAALWQKNFKPEQYQIYFFDSGPALLQATTATVFDCVYLDIQMPGFNGIDTAKQLRKNGCAAPIIFLTNYDDYLEVGYEVQAFRYRFKPLQEDLFLEDIHAWQQSQQQKEMVSFHTSDGIHRLTIDELIYVEIVHRKVQLVTTHGTFICKESMQHWETILPAEQFLAPYNKILVNANHVKFFDQTKIITTNQHQLPMSRRKYQQFKANMMRP